MPQVMFDEELARSKLRSIGRPSPKSLEQLSAEQEIKKETIPPFVLQLNPSEAAEVRKGPSASPGAARHNAWVWYFGVEIDPKFKALSMAEQNRRRMSFFREYILPTTNNAEELLDIQKSFLKAGKIPSLVAGATAGGKTLLESVTPPVGSPSPYTGMRGGMLPTTRPPVPQPPVENKYPPRPYDPLFYMAGEQGVGLLPLLAVSAVAPESVLGPKLSSALAASKIGRAAPLIERAAHGAVVFGATNIPPVLSGQESLGAGLENTATAILGFSPKSKLIGAALAGGFEAALGRPAGRRYTGIPAIDAGLSGALQMGVTRLAFEGRTDVRRLMVKAYADRLGRKIEALERRDTGINLLAKNAKTGGETAEFERQVLDRLATLRGLTPAGRIDNIIKTEMPSMKAPPKDRITAQLPAEEEALIKRNVEDFKQQIGRKMNIALVDLVPKLEQAGNKMMANSVRTAAEQWRAAAEKGNEFAILTAHENWKQVLFSAEKAVGHIHPEYFTGGNAILRIAPEHRGTLSKTHYGQQTRRAIELISENPPQVDIERWNSLSDEVGPSGVSQRDIYLRDLMYGPQKAFSDDVLAEIGMDRSSLAGFIRTMRDRGYFEESPTIVDGLGIPAVSIAHKRVSKEVRAGAVPEDPATQEALRHSQFLLDELHRTDMPSNVKGELERLLKQHLLPNPPTGRLSIYPRAPQAYGGRVSDSTARLIINEIADSLAGPVLTEEQVTRSFAPEQPPTAGAYDPLTGRRAPTQPGTPSPQALPPEIQRTLPTGEPGAMSSREDIIASASRGTTLPPLQSGEGRIDKRGLYRNHLQDRYTSLRGEGYGVEEAYNIVTEEAAALRDIGTVAPETWQKTFSLATEKVASRKPPAERYGVDYKTLESGQRALDGMQVIPEQALSRGASEADPWAAAAELQRAGLNGRYNRATNDIEIETVPGSGRFVKSSFQELKNLAGPGNFTPDGKLIISTQNGKYDIIRTRDGKLEAVERTSGRKPKGFQRPLTWEEFRTVLFAGTGWRLEVMHPDGSAQIFDPMTRETRILSPEELKKAATQPQQIEDFTPEFPFKPDAGSYDPAKERDTPTDFAVISPEDIPEIAPTRNVGPALPSRWKEWRAEYEAANPLRPNPTPDQLRDWREGLAAYISSRSKKGTFTAGMGVPSGFSKKGRILELSQQDKMLRRLAGVPQEGPPLNKIEEDLRLQATAKGAAKGKYPTDEVDEMMFIREFLQNELEKEPRGRGVIMHMGGVEAPGFVRKTTEAAKGLYGKRHDIGPPGLFARTKSIFSHLQEGPVGTKYKLPFYEVWRTTEEYATSVREWARETNPETAKVLKHLRGKDQAAILEYLKAETWEHRLAVRDKYHMSKEEIDLVGPVRSLLQQAFGTKVGSYGMPAWQEFLNIHYPSYIASKQGNVEDRETPEMKTWREKGALVGNPTDLTEMIPNALSARSRMSMNDAFEQHDSLLKMINDFPEDLTTHEGYLRAKAEQASLRMKGEEERPELRKYIRDLEQSVMPHEMKSELIEKLLNYRARVTWGVSSDHKAARRFIETVYESAGVNVDKALFDKIMPNYLLLSYSSTMPGRAGMIIRNLMQPTMTVFPYVGAENYARGLKAYWGHTSGIKKNAELADLFTELGLDQLQGVALEHLLAGTLDTSTIPKKGAAWLRRRYNTLMKPFAWSELVNRRQAVSVGYIAMKDFGGQFLDKAISERELLRRTGLVYMDKATIREVLEPLRSGKLIDASKRFAQNLAEDTQWIYHAGNTPEIFNSRIGRFFGQFGTWPLSWIRFAKHGMMSGDKLSSVQFMIRMAAVNFALQKAGEEVFGIRPGSWLWAGPMSYAGGPGAGLFAAFYYATRPGFRREMGLHDLAQGFTTFIPFYMMARDIVRTTQAEDLPSAMKALSGFRPYEK